MQELIGPLLPTLRHLDELTPDNLLLSEPTERERDVRRGL